MSKEPSVLVGAITGALASTIGLLAIVLEWSEEVTKSLLAASGGWVMVAAIVISGFVSPTNKPFTLSRTGTYVVSKRDAGYTLFELLVFIVIVILACVGVYYLFAR